MYCTIDTTVVVVSYDIDSTSSRRSERVVAHRSAGRAIR